MPDNDAATTPDDETEDLLFSGVESIKKVVAEPHRKRKQVRSNKHALSNLAASVERVAEAQPWPTKYTAIYVTFKRLQLRGRLLFSNE